MNAATTPLTELDATDASAVVRRLPENFVWGVATSAFQIEGTVPGDGRADSIWDTFCRKPGVIRDGSHGITACEHYLRANEDLDLIARLGVPSYRFSIAWPRVQPEGHGAWNPVGLDFYDRLVDGLLARGIAAHITLNHWDLPQALQDAGGWNSRDTVDHFVDYARGVAARIGDRVASIATHNEPWVIAVLGHDRGIFAPGIKDRRIAAQVSHHLLLSHGRALEALRADGVRAPLGIVLNQAPVYPATPTAEDVAAARLEDGGLVRWYMDPLFKGAYPADVIASLGADAPVVRDGDFKTITAPLDFLGLNYYTRNLASASAPFVPGSTGLELTDMGWEVYPKGLTDLLVRLHADYPLPPLYVMENGAAFPDPIRDGRVDDEARIRYLSSHMHAVADARDRGVDVRGYFVWSLLDNFEWADGYLKRFGLVHVDYATQRRTPKASAEWYSRLLSQVRARRADSAGG